MSKDQSERTCTLLEYDSIIRRDAGGYLCGVDEAGRGPIAGPVVAAAVIFADDVYIEGVFDSKKISRRKREELYAEIIDSALCWGAGIVGSAKIDEINIQQATIEAMNIAVRKLSQSPALIVADGNFYTNNSARVSNVIKADEKSFTVAAASIIAKVTRDRIMCEYENIYPDFTFSHHKGYGTPGHIDEIIENGYTDIHRKTFRLKAVQGVLF